MRQCTTDQKAYQAADLSLHKTTGLFPRSNLIPQAIKFNIRGNFERISRTSDWTIDINPRPFGIIGLLQREAAPVPIKRHDALFPHEVEQGSNPARRAISEGRPEYNVIACELVLMHFNGQHVVASDKVADKRSGNTEDVGASGVTGASIRPGRIGHTCVGNCSRSGSHSQPSDFHAVQIEDGAVVDEIA